MLTGTSVIVFGAVMFSSGNFYWILFAISLLMALVSVPKALVKNSHWRASKDAILILDVGEKKFEHKQSAVSKSFFRNDIQRCLVVHSGNYAEHFTTLYLKDGSRLVLSSYLISASELFYKMKLHYVAQEVKFPIIGRQHQRLQNTANCERSKAC